MSGFIDADLVWLINVGGFADLSWLNEVDLEWLTDSLLGLILEAIVL